MEKYLKTVISQEIGVRRQEAALLSPHPTSHFPHPTPHTPLPTSPDIPIEMALSALIIPDQATKVKI
ncbi:hypothetical protein [Microcystis aeruginosa]|uniref:hypothetical protein n=1 Tax=Microcystis aeruginosa TaxID=1126 RepID=UPI001330E9E2|nr:hypothetical protein [Microcystis aeruginosa]